MELHERLMFARMARGLEEGRKLSRGTRRFETAPSLLLGAHRWEILAMRGNCKQRLTVNKATRESKHPIWATRVTRSRGHGTGPHREYIWGRC